jgi:predicted RND superfamily exporter protein
MNDAAKIVSDDPLEHSQRAADDQLARVASRASRAGSGSKAPSPSNRLSASVASLACFCAAHARFVVMLSWLLAAGCALLSSRLSIDAGFAALLPADTESVRHVRELEHRLRVPATYMIGIEANQPQVRAAAADDLILRAARIDSKLVSGVTADDQPARRFTWAHRWLFAPLSELEAARDSLQTQFERASPFDLGVGDSDDTAAAGADALWKRLDQAKREADAPGTFVSTDGRLQLVLLRTTFSGGDVDRGRALTELLRGLGSDIERAHPGAKIGLAGDVVTTLAEHDALLRGMLLSTLATAVLVLGALLLFYRSALAVGALAWALSVGVLGTFAFTFLAIGHLNIASAFLSSIVIGNGINSGLVLLARYLEEREQGAAVLSSLELAARGTAPGTLAAALTATVAYGSLALTPFRGFRDFGIIGAAGMIACWLSAYTILPAGLMLAGERIQGKSPLRLGAVLARLTPSRPRVVAALGLALLGLTTTSTVCYLTSRPLEDDLRNLRSYTAALDDASRWMDKFDRAFGHGLDGGFAIGVAQRAEAPLVAARLRAVDAGKPEAAHLFSSIHTLDDALPADQAQKLALLGEIRVLLDSPMLRRLPPSERQRLNELRPPDTLHVLGDQDVPAELAWPFTERDGTRGRLVLANTGLAVDGWRVSSLVSFARTVKSMKLGRDVVIGGSAFVFSDMLEAMRRDGPRATFAALIGSCLVIFGLFRRSRAAWVTLLCALLGSTGLLSAAWALGIKVNFLDFVALPITIGIGVDYAVNIAARARDLGGSRPGRNALIGVGPAVVLCSYTTIVGYASLLFSQNRGIHSFGLSAMLGELTCLTAATLFAPALLDGRLGAQKELE